VDSRVARSVRITTTADTGETFTIADTAAERATKIVGFDDDGNVALYDPFLATPEDLPGHALYIPRVTLDETEYELRSPAETRADIGADVATNLTSGTVANARLTTNLTTIGDLVSIANML